MVGKKISGIKVHLGVDTLGLPHSIRVTTAEVSDRAGALKMLGFRRLWKNCERKLYTVHQMLTLAFIALLLHRY